MINSTGERFNPLAGKMFSDKRVLVVGAARSGLAAAELLLELGACVLLNDQKPLESLGVLPLALQHERCSLFLGEPAEQYLKEADMLLISPGIPITAPLVQMAQKLGIPVWGELAFAAFCAVQDILAVSGTNGKTTTVSLLGEMLNQSGRIAHVAGNIGYPLSAAVLRAKPEDVLVAEVSSFQLETAGGFHPRMAALLNITPDHLDRHLTMARYIGLKKRLFDNMARGDVAVLNYDDDKVRSIADEIAPVIVWFSRSGAQVNGAVFDGDAICWRENGETRFMCAAADLKIPGAHNIENALAATAMASLYGVPLQVVAYTLKRFRGVEHRIEFVEEVAGVRWLNDSKGTNPDSTIKAVKAMTAPTVLIAGGYDKQVPFEALAVSIQQSGQIKRVVLMGQTASKIEHALRQEGFHQITMTKSLEEAVDIAASLAQPNGNVLFSPACASFDMFTDYEQRGRVFKHLVRQLVPRRICDADAPKLS